MPVATRPVLKSRHFRWRWLWAVAALTALFHFTPAGRTLDRAWLDWTGRHPVRAPAEPPPSAIVLIDDATMARMSEELGLRWPYPRLAFAALIVALERAGAERILMDFTFVEASAAAEQDAVLARVAAATPGVVMARTRKATTVFWDAAFRAEHAAWFATPREGFVDLLLDEDQIPRRYVVEGSLAEAALGAKAAAGGGEGGAGLLRWYGGLKELPDPAVQRVPAYPFIEAGLGLLMPALESVPDPTEPGAGEALAKVLTGAPRFDDAVAAQVRGRTVFVGANAHGTYDRLALPVGEGAEPGVLVHWTAWANLSTSGLLTALPRGASFGFGLVCALALAGLARRRSGVGAVAVTAGVLVVGVLSVAYVAPLAGWAVAPATPVLVAAIMLGVVAVENFLLERARKQEVQAMFGVFVDPVVVEQLVRDPEALRLTGDRREATVFFSDLAGFTDFSERLPPDQLFELVNAYLDETSEALIERGAYVDKYIGDAVMAVFGAPKPLPDAPGAACAGALATLRVIEGLNARHAAAVGTSLAVRVGINTGLMTFGSLGSARKKNYTVLGDAVNLASRLEAANKEFGTNILLGDTTARRLGPEFATRPLARLRVKGKLEAIEVHELVGETALLGEVERAFLAAYREGYARHLARDFALAATYLDRALALRPNDVTTAAHLADARNFIANAPASDWQPLLKLTSK